MRVRKLGTWVGRLVAVAAFGLGTVVSGALVDFQTNSVVTADSHVSPAQTEWT